MKTKILGGIAVLAVAAVAAWNVNLRSQTNGMSDVKLANVEALADETSSNTYKPCKVGDTADWGEVYTWCGVCAGAKIIVTGDGYCRLN